ncbi:MAG: oligosaccharide flippase family protein [Candidatus Binatia bacterium]
MTEADRGDHPQPTQAILASFLALTGGQLVARGLTFLLTLHLTRALGAESFGILVLAGAVLGYAVLVVHFGFDTLALLEAGRRPDLIRRLAGSLVWLRIALALVGFVLLAAFVELAPLPDRTRVVAVLYGLSLSAYALDSSWAFLGALPVRPVAVAGVLAEALILVSAWTWISGPDDIARMPLIYLGGRLAGAAYLWGCFTLRFGRPIFALDRPLLGSLFREALPLAGAAVLAQLIYNFDVVLLGMWVGLAETGHYGAAFRFVQLLRMLSISYFRAFQSPLAWASREGLERVAVPFARGYQVSGAIALGLTVGGGVLASDLVAYLFGDDYLPAAEPLRLLLVAFAFAVLSRHYRIALVAFGYNRFNFCQLAIAAALNIGLNVVFIPRHGILASAWAMVATEAFLFFVSYPAARRWLGPVPSPGLLWRPALAALALGGLLIALAEWSLIARLGLGGAAYVLLLFSLGVIRVRELADALLSR